MKASLVPWIWGAGVVQLAIAAANVFLPTALDYHTNLAKVSPLVRQIFIIHSLYLVEIVVALGMVCLFFAEDLAGGSSLGRAISWGLAVFWMPRLFIQLFYYDRAVRRAYPAKDALMVIALAYLTLVWGMVLWGGRPS